MDILLGKEIVVSTTARKWTDSGKRIRCAYCGRDRFSTPQPHKCNSISIRKRKLRWLLLDEAMNMPEELVDKRIEIAGRMLKAAGKVTPKDLGEAALICIQLACQLEDPEGYFQNVDLKIKEGILTLNANDILKRALKHADRREFLGRYAKNCPNCGTKQVQLINYLVSPAEWKCRHCKTQFIFEPDAT